MFLPIRSDKLGTEVGWMTWRLLHEVKSSSFSRAFLILLFVAGVPAWGGGLARLQLAKSSCRATLQVSDATAANQELEKVLNVMDATAANFRTAEADFEWDQYTKVVDETDKQTGKIYFRRAGGQTQMSADIRTSNGKPIAKYVLFTDGKVQVYQPTINDQVDQYNTGNNREAVESFLVLGFGGSGQDMRKSFDVSYLGADADLGGAAKLNLVPKGEKVRNMFDHIVLWIDLSLGISVQQQLFTGQGDYRLAKYSDIKLKAKIPDSAFKLKTTNKTQIVSH
jgi:outer membrane lipoprotein-sorting protein